VAEALTTDGCAQCAVTGAPSERATIDEVLAEAKCPILDLAARSVTLGSLKAVLKRAALLITNDTGPRHMAAAFGTPTIALFGPTDHRWTTLHGANERLLVAEPFLPENLIADQHAALCAVDRIRAGDVLAVAQQMLPAAQQACRAQTKTAGLDEDRLHGL
jgi:heptosyltransferase-2